MYDTCIIRDSFFAKESSSVRTNLLAGEKYSTFNGNNQPFFGEPALYFGVLC